MFKTLKNSIIRNSFTSHKYTVQRNFTKAFQRNTKTHNMGYITALLNIEPSWLQGSKSLHKTCNTEHSHSTDRIKNKVSVWTSKNKENVITGLIAHLPNMQCPYTEDHPTPPPQRVILRIFTI